MAQIRDRHGDGAAMPGTAPKEEPLVLGLAHRHATIWDVSPGWA
jgi:hypothetical protein